MTSAAPTPRPQIPIVPPPQGVTFRVSSHAPMSEVSGLCDFQVVLAGLARFHGIELFVDDKQQGGSMTRIAGNRYLQTVDTAQFVDGSHRVAVAAVDPRGDVMASVFTDLLFRNVHGLSIITLRRNEAGSGFAIQLAVSTLRTQLQVEAFSCVDRTESANEILECALDYEGGTIHGTPIPTLYASWPRTKHLSPGLHQLQITVRDNEGTPRARAARALLVSE